MTGYQQFSQARVTHCALAIVTVYLGLAHGMNFKPLAEGLRVIQMSLSLMCVIAYWPHAKECFVWPGHEWPPKENLIGLGIALAWLSVFCNGAWGMFWRMSGQPQWMVNNDFYQSWVLFNVIAATLHIIAPNLIGHGVPRADRIRLGGAWAFAFFLIAVLGVAKPDLSEMAEVLRPYFEEPPESTGLKPDDATLNDAVRNWHGVGRVV